jgi:hypothetical protein
MSAPADPRLPAAYAPRPEAGPGEPGDRAADPLRFCVFTTVALLAWLLGPPAVVAAMSALGLRAYLRAVRRGLTESRCVLRRPKLVLAYLASALVAAVAYLAYGVATGWAAR